MPLSATEAGALGSARRTLGKYEILSRLAIGGMAEIYLARAAGISGFEKHVVLKCMHARFAEQPTFVAMFLDEARLAARLHHHNIVQINDFGCEDGTYFIAMEYLHGVDVQALLRRSSETDQPIPLQHTIAIVTGVAAGLHYAHGERDSDGQALGIVHRDIAPSNIIVTYDGAVKLLDFGIARARINTHETDVGRVRGKLAYMSPEQCRAEPIDGRSDLFSLGIVLYEMTTMTRLFGGDRGDRLDIMRRIVSGRVDPPSTRVAGYPPELERIVMRALKAPRQQRYQTGEEMAGDLERFARHHGMSLSAGELGRYVTRLLGRRPEPWRVEPGESSASAPSPEPVSPPAAALAPAAPPPALAPAAPPPALAPAVTSPAAASAASSPAAASTAPAAPPAAAAIAIARGAAPARPPGYPAASIPVTASALARPRRLRMRVAGLAARRPAVAATAGLGLLLLLVIVLVMSSGATLSERVPDLSPGAASAVESAAGASGLADGAGDDGDDDDADGGDAAAEAAGGDSGSARRARKHRDRRSARSRRSSRRDRDARGRADAPETDRDRAGRRGRRGSRWRADDPFPPSLRR